MTLSDVNVLHSAHYPACTAYVDKQFDGYMTLQYSPTSGVDVAYDDVSYTLEGPWFWPAYPGPHIRFGRAQGLSSWDHRYIAINGALTDEWRVMGLFPERPQRPPVGRDYTSLFDEMLALVRHTDRWRHAKAINILESMLIDLAIDRAQTPHSETWLDGAIERIVAADAPYEPDYDAIAADCGMALSTFRRRFRDAKGVAVHTFVLNRRIDHARQLLGDTDLPLKAIADRLGYKDVYYFSQQFRLLAGVSPGAYRKSRQG